MGSVLKPAGPGEETRPRAAGAEEQHAGSPTARALLVLLVLLLATAASLAPAMSRPAVVGADAAASEFSAERARVHLREITRARHPTGTAAHAEVRNYLVASLRALGLEPEIQHATAVSGRYAGAAAAVQNIIARMPGTAPTRALFLASHYDSAPTSYGAADAGNGVAAILETVRALQAGPPLRNDVVILFTDAEEGGLMGAHAFVAEHPLAADVGVVLNAEGRGNTGPVAMFRASPQSGELVRTLAASVPGAVASSLTSDVLRRMRNDTDLAVFLRAGLAGMDFANGHGVTHYHTPRDNFEQADPRTLQHHGSYLLALARTLGDRDLTALAAPDRVYFTLPLLRIIHYPAAWALPLALFGMLLVAGLLAGGFIQRRLRPRIALVSGLAWLAAVLVLPAVAFAGWRLLRTTLPDVSPWPALFVFGYDRAFYLAAFLALVAAAVLVILWRLLRRATAAELLAVPLAAWSLLALASAIALPGGSYVFTWPLLFAAAAMAVLLTGWPPEARHRTVLLAALAVPPLLIVPQVIYLLELMLTMDAIPVPVLLLALLLGLLIPQLELVRRGLRWRAPAALAALGVVVLAIGISRSGVDAASPRLVSLFYVARPESGEAFWASTDRVPSGWSRQYLGAAPDRRVLHEWGYSSELWLNTAPVLVSDGFDVALVENRVLDEDRRLRLRVVPPPGTWQTRIRLPGGATARDVVVDGRPVPQVGDMGPVAAGTVVELTGAPRQGFEVAFTLPAAIAELRMHALTPGVPAVPDRVVAAPPDSLVIASEYTHVIRIVPIGDADMTVEYHAGRSDSPPRPHARRPG